MPELFTVFGATGVQGGSILEAVLKSPTLSQKYNIRGVTRDVNKESAKSLILRGVEVVQGDLNDPKSVLTAAEGSSLIFGVSDFWAVGANENLEAAQGRNIADAAKATGALLIWSTLPSIKDISNGNLTKAALYESKASADKYIKSLNVPCVYFLAAGYMNLFKTMYAPQKIEGTNKYRFTHALHPDTQMPLLSATHDVGNFLAPILESPKSFIDTRVIAATRYYTMTEIVKSFTAVTGVEVEYQEVSDEEYWAALRGGSLDFLSSLSPFMREYDPMGPGGKEELEKSLARMTEKPEEFEDWLKRNGPWFQD